MTPAALRSYRILRALGLPAGVLRKVAIGMDGRPNFSRLSDAEFDRLMRAVGRVYPHYEDLAREALEPP
jgi:hypothetical protein